MARDLGDEIRLFEETFEQIHDALGDGIIGHSQNNDAAVFARGIVPDIGEIHVSRYDGRPGVAGMGGYPRVRSLTQAKVTGKFSNVAKAGQQCHGRARHVGVHQKAHASRGEQVEGFPIGEPSDEFERGTNVFRRQVIFLSHFVKGHAARQTANNERNGHARAANNRLAMANGRVNDDAVVFIHTTVIIYHIFASEAISNGKPIVLHTASHFMTKGRIVLVPFLSMT